MYMKNEKITNSGCAFVCQREYVKNVIKQSNWIIKIIGDIELYYVSTEYCQLFNYAFVDPYKETTEDNIKKVLQYGYENGIELTWMCDAKMKRTISVLERLKVERVSTPKRAFLQLDNYVPDFSQVPDVTLKDAAENIEILNEYDRLTSIIFAHNKDGSSAFLRGLVDIPQSDSPTKVFLVKLGNITVGIAALYVQDDVALFMSDGVLRDYRRRGIHSAMILKRIEIAKALNCERVTAHCIVDSSEASYTKVGFKMLGQLNMYMSRSNIKYC